MQHVSTTYFTKSNSYKELKTPIKVMSLAIDFFFAPRHKPMELFQHLSATFLKLPLQVNSKQSCWPYVLFSPSKHMPSNPHTMYMVYVYNIFYINIITLVCIQRW